MRTLIYYVIMVLLLVALFCCVLAVGAVRIPLPDVCAALFGGEVKETYRYIVLQARLPMALGVAGCIILAGTDLTGGRVAGLTAFVAAILLQRADVANRVLAGGAPANIVLVLLLVMLIGACVGLINGFVMAKFKVHPYIITLAMQMIVYGIYLTVSNSVQVGSFDSSYTTPVPNSNRRSPQRHCHLHRGSHVCAAGADRDRADVGRLEQDRFRQKHVCRRF